MEKHIQKLLSLIGFRIFLIVTVLITGILQFSLMVGEVKEDTYDITLGSLAPETIRATKTIEDTEKTNLEKKLAEQSIEPVYEYKEEIKNQRISYLDLFFEVVTAAKIEIQDEEDIDETKKLEILNEKLKSLSNDDLSIDLSNEQKKAIIAASQDELTTVQAELKKAVESIISKPLSEDQINDKKNEVEVTLLNNQLIPEKLATIVVKLARSAIVPTNILNEEKTEELKEQAVNNVDPTRIIQGQIIVLEGEVVQSDAYRQLELLGITDGKTSLRPILGVVILIFLQMAFMFALFSRSSESEIKRVKNMVITSLVFILSLCIMKLINNISGAFDVMIAFLYPTAMATMLIRLLVNERTAAIVTVLLASCSGIMFQANYVSVLQMEIVLYILFGGFASILFMRSVEKRSHILQASGIIVLLNVSFITFYLLMTQTSYGITEIGFYLGAAIISGTLSGALTMGILPFFEMAFGVLSTLRLIELSNPNHPLLKKILTETPGTYHHSVMVANLAESACEAIGADGLLARVGCYYHDVGKTRRPAFFIENQMGMNPHDAISPKASAEIIIAHTTEGAEMLRKHKMPQEIIDIALQHHGTSLLKYFVHKAKENGEEVDENSFRYPGPKPQTKEIAIISIADSVEAAVRSMKEPTAEKISNLIQNIIKDRITDNQFDECDISLKELKTIHRVLCESLNGIFHTRIEYPKETTVQLEQKKEKEEKVLSK